MKRQRLIFKRRSKDSTDKLNQAQGDITQGQLNFMLSAVPMGINVVSTLSQVLQGLRASKIANIAATAAEATAMAGDTASTVTN